MSSVEEQDRIADRNTHGEQPPSQAFTHTLATEQQQQQQQQHDPSTTEISPRSQPPASQPSSVRMTLTAPPRIAPIIPAKRENSVKKGTSCLYCRARKQRCDRSCSGDQCTQCRKRGVSCMDPPQNGVNTYQPAPSQAYRDALAITTALKDSQEPSGSRGQGYGTTPVGSPGYGFQARGAEGIIGGGGGDASGYGGSSAEGYAFASSSRSGWEGTRPGVREDIDLERSSRNGMNPGYAYGRTSDSNGSGGGQVGSRSSKGTSKRRREVHADFTDSEGDEEEGGTDDVVTGCCVPKDGRGSIARGRPSADPDVSDGMDPFGRSRLELSDGREVKPRVGSSTSPALTVPRSQRRREDGPPWNRPIVTAPPEVDDEIDELMEEDEEDADGEREPLDGVVSTRSEGMLGVGVRSLANGLTDGHVGGEGSENENGARSFVQTVGEEVAGELLNLAAGRPTSNNKHKRPRLSARDSVNFDKRYHQADMQLPIGNLPPLPGRQRAHLPAAHVSERDVSSRSLHRASGNGPLNPGLHGRYLGPGLFVAGNGSRNGAAQAHGGHYLSAQPPMDAGPHLGPYTTTLHTLMVGLPSAAVQAALFEVFFADVLLTEGVTHYRELFLGNFRSLLAKDGQIMRLGDATTLAIAFAILALATRILPESASQLLIAGEIAYPRSFCQLLGSHNPADTPVIHVGYVDHACMAARLADADDGPSVSLVMLKLLLHRYTLVCSHAAVIDVSTGACGTPDVRKSMTNAGAWLAGAVQVAHMLGLHRHTESAGETVNNDGTRELFQSLFVADRYMSFVTNAPYLLLAAPKAVSPSDTSRHTQGDDEEANQTLTAEDQALGLPPSPASHLAITVELSRQLTPILEALHTVGISSLENSSMEKHEAALTSFEEALPPCYRTYPETDHSWDEERFVVPHRLHLHAWLSAIRMRLLRPTLVQVLDPDSPTSARQRVVRAGQQVLRTHRSARMLDPKRAFRIFGVGAVFEAAVCLGLVYFVEKRLAAGDSAEHRRNSQSRDDQMASTRLAVAECIELLEGVLLWPDSVYEARRSLKVLRALQHKLTPSTRSKIGRGPTTAATFLENGQVTSPSETGQIKEWLKRSEEQGLVTDGLLSRPDWSAWAPIIDEM